ncbi:Uu.00g123220.m01.CDS01 [Anthostomella pinea]|uniref:Uu.00g123220.m01.CDS01 n=1 Tax=Anthostomella pinea TaxID=933095 RepID=A0AAI8VHA4_9PEZI|nr:Uu.00g123220.m01.CDS01 [Anthostomella pinea]
MSADRIFEPLKLGHCELKHRMVMAPLTRFRATSDHVPGKYAREYYSQRASCPGTLIVTEATFIAPQAGGYNNVPGIYNHEQVKAWKEITDAVHTKGSYIYLQLWALGRVAVAENLLRQGPYPVVSSSANPLNSEFEVPKEMTEEDIQAFVGYYANAARKAMGAGFDGVEIHGANGYLIDQFWQDRVNTRTDKYGGSVENRARFGLEVTKAVIEACGGDSKKVGIRLSPWSPFQGMRMEDPIPQFSHIISELKKLGLSYLHLVESRLSGTTAGDSVYGSVTGTNDKLVELWGTEAPVILAGGFDPEKARKALSEVYPAENVCIAYGRYFISNPDLPFRIKHGIELAPYNRKTFYLPEKAEGFIDYPFSKEFLAQEKESKL